MSSYITVRTHGPATSTSPKRPVRRNDHDRHKHVGGPCRHRREKTYPKRSGHVPLRSREDGQPDLSAADCMSRVLQRRNTASQELATTWCTTTDIAALEAPGQPLNHRQGAPAKRSNLQNDASIEETTPRAPSSPIRQADLGFHPETELE